MTCGTASVSTLLIVVSRPNRPAAAGMAFDAGLPRLPSMEFMSAVSSPQM
jgi:hypothetical protein